ncbi:MAG: NupC/NupG family nucleoside CNT transporter [Spirochaetota bacterium]|jgi:CNT family concentrative nucleoside transporter|nr:NupC/NupG family nucleoside CNT transporter [Spirochaetota bacterium]
MERLIGIVGILFFIGVAWLMSENKRQVKWRPVLLGLLLQFLVALFVLKTAPGRMLFAFLNDVVDAMLGFTTQGATFVFGDLKTKFSSFALTILPTVIFFSSFFAVLYYFGILQLIVKAFAFVLHKLLDVSGAEAVSCAANVLMGQTEAPLTIKPFIEGMTHSELMTVMTGGMATVAGGVLAAYVSMGVDAGSLIAASVMNAPAAIVFAKIITPELAKPLTADLKAIKVEILDRNALEAAARGAGEGVFLAINIAAMLLAFVATVYLINFFFGIFGTSMEEILSVVLRPVAFLMGAPWSEAGNVAALMGKRTILNEFIAYSDLGDLIHIRKLYDAMGDGNILYTDFPFISNTIQPMMTLLGSRSIMLASYSLCGFANLSSMAIQLGGIGGMAPSRRGEIASLGLKSMLAGTMATFLTGTIALIIF